jgi:hypothetical protein
METTAWRLGGRAARCTLDIPTTTSLTRRAPMNDIEQLRADLAELRAAMQTMSALLALALVQVVDARGELASIKFNLDAATKGKPANPTLDAMASAVLLPLSSTALKQHPNDPQVLQWYRELRPGQRH